MSPSPHVRVQINLSRIRSNVQAVGKLTGVPVIAVVKADAYGLGAGPVSAAIADLVAGYYVFDLREAIQAKLANTGRRTIVLRGESSNPADYTPLGAQPAVWNADAATALKFASPILSVDTGQQRFGVSLEDRQAIDAILKVGAVREAFTHATRVDQASALSAALRERVPVLHAAGTALLGEPAARLDAVRPGLALYQGAVKVVTRLVEVVDSGRPAGYSGFIVPRHGVILAGYSNGLGAGPCRINGRAGRILEVGMQSAFVECAPGDRVGDEVELLGDAVTVEEVVAAWRSSPQEALLRMTAMGERRYTQA